MEKRGHPRSKSTWESERKDHQDLAPLALSPGVGTGDTQIALATFREIKKVGEHHGSHIEKGHCYEVRCTFQESEGWSPWFSKTCKDSVLFWRPVEASCLWGQWWEGTVLKTIQHSLLEGAEGDQCPAQGCCGLETPLSSGTGGAPQAPHWASGVLACMLQTFIRCMICKHLVPFWMAGLFPYSFCAQQIHLLSFVVCGFGSRSKKSRPDPNSWSFSLMFSSMGCIILVLTSRPLIHFELILNSEGSRGPTLFLCRWNLVVPEPVLIVGENICKWCHQKGLISKIHKQHMHLKKINK